MAKKPKRKNPTGDEHPADPAWLKKTLPLPSGHQWKCSPGYNLFVADRGAVRFEFPEGWMSRPNPKDGSIGLHDAEPPADNVALRVSILRLPPGIPAAALAGELSVETMLRGALTKGNGKKPTEWDGLIHRVAKLDAEVVWAESSFIDEDQNRPARSRTCLARARGVQPLITLDYWETDVAIREPLWAHVMNTLRIAAPVDMLGQSGN